ncbi:DUF4124 domain-containing protein [Acinetobacter silvestris]|uniref:DUF4124 domain-containing protein n=1 Tax=Acinetobacter silvestris TaxID=1977882 RepID=A0A1Y3CL10_9GAMM|nr:DUF4124 domain-containing protein [Acinetobacter silvestris]OTG66579.1 hypothetical protein B9T28_04845 [Acinetobacter silvestris]
MKMSLMIFLFLGVSTIAQADSVYKCENKGTITYQSRPCPSAIIKPNLHKQIQEKKQNQFEAEHYSQQKHLQHSSSNGTSNEIADTEAGKKKSLAIAQEAYRMTKNR